MRRVAFSLFQSECKLLYRKPAMFQKILDTSLIANAQNIVDRQCPDNAQRSGAMAIPVFPKRVERCTAAILAMVWTLLLG